MKGLNFVLSGVGTPAKGHVMHLEPRLNVWNGILGVVLPLELTFALVGLLLLCSVFVMFLDMHGKNGKIANLVLLAYYTLDTLTVLMIPAGEDKSGEYMPMIFFALAAVRYILMLYIGEPAILKKEQ